MSLGERLRRLDRRLLHHQHHEESETQWLARLGRSRWALGAQSHVLGALARHVVDLERRVAQLEGERQSDADAGPGVSR